MFDIPQHLIIVDVKKYISLSQTNDIFIVQCDLAQVDYNQ